MFDKPMPWCDRCQCWHHDTAEHIHSAATLTVTDKDIEQMERLRTSITMIVVALIVLAMGIVVGVCLYKAEHQLVTDVARPRVVDLNQLQQCKRTYGCDTDDILIKSSED